MTTRKMRRPVSKKPRWLVIVIAIAAIVAVVLIVASVVMILNGELNKPQESVAPIGDNGNVVYKPAKEEPVLRMGMSVLHDGKRIYTCKDEYFNRMKIEPEEIYEVKTSVWAYGVMGSPIDPNYVSNARIAYSIEQGAGCYLSLTGLSWADADERSHKCSMELGLSNDEPFWLEYLYGESTLTNQALGTVVLPDKVVTAASSEHGVQVGTSVLDGDLPYGEFYKCQTTIKVVPHLISYNLSQKWRVAGEDVWRNGEIDAPVGTEIEMAIEYQNKDTHLLNGISIRATTNDLDVDPGSFVFGRLDLPATNDETLKITGMLPVLGDTINILYYSSENENTLDASSAPSPLYDSDGDIYCLKIDSCRPEESITVLFRATVTGDMPMPIVTSEMVGAEKLS